METNGRIGFRRKAKRWIRHPFKTSASQPQDTPAQEKHEDVTIKLTAASASQPSKQKPKVQDSTGPRDLWQAAYDQLSEAQKHILSIVKLPVEVDSIYGPTSAIIDEVVKTTERQYEEYQNGGLKIPGPAGKQINIRKVSERIINAALSFKDFMRPFAGLDLTQNASAVLAVVLLGLTMVQNHFASRAALFQSSGYLIDVLTRVVFVEREFYRVDGFKGGDDLESAIVRVYRAVLLYTVEVRSAQNPSKGRKVMDYITAMTDQSFKNLQSSIDQEEQYLQHWVTMEQHLQRKKEAEDQLAQIDRVLSDLRRLRDEFILAKLVSLDDASFDAYQEDGDMMDEYEGRCLPGTRTELLEQVTEWAASPDGQCIFWLNGMAGTGKSTIAKTLAASFHEKGILGASFFFKRGEGDRGKAKRLFTTITKQLVTRMPQLIPGIVEAIRQDGGISEKSLSVQFQKLLQEPLLDLDQSGRQSRTLVIVIDALDECESERDTKNFLHLLPQLAQLKSVRLRIFLTSRPDISEDLFKGWQDKDRRHLLLHTIPEPIIERDINLFLSNRLAKIREDNQQLLGPDWPGKDTVQQLVTISVPLFIFAATICRFVGEKTWSPKQRLDDFLSHPAVTSGSEMDRTYLPILEQPFRGIRRENEKEILMEEFHSIIGVIVLLATPLSINTLSALICIETNLIAKRVTSFSSVLKVPHDSDVPVQILHLSFRDFLLNTDSRFHVEEREVHTKLLAQCFKIMETLKHNICGLKSYGTNRDTIPRETTDQCLSPELRYSCRYWAYHLEQSKEGKSFGKDVQLFLEEHLLHWLEAMSLMGFVRESAGIFETLLSIFQDTGETNLFNLLHDTSRFIRRNIQIADAVPLQLYCSGLVFAPKESYVRRLFEAEIPRCISILPSVENSWGLHLQTLEGHEGPVKAVVFSPDGRLLVSGSYDGSVRIWDTSTGTQQHRLGHESYVNTVVLSPDGRLVASGSDDRTACIWDTVTGTQQHELSHTDSVTTVAFSPDRRLLATGSADKTVRVWDIITGIQQHELRHEDAINIVVFSPDGHFVASGSDDKTVRIWDAATGTQQHELCHEDCIKTVAFSPDGHFVISGSDDKTVRIWDAATGTQQHMLNHRDWVTTVAFSPDSCLLASGSDDKKVRIWDTATGTQHHKLSHADWVTTVVFSPDGRLLASGSRDKAVHIWDTATGTEQHKLTGHRDWVPTVIFSPDSRLVASGSDDATVRVWDTVTGIQHPELDGHKYFIKTAVFSPDGRIVASGSTDKTVRIWDAATGTQQHKLTGHKNRVNTVVFSPDGCLVASGSHDKTIRVWDTFTGIQQHELTGHEDRVNTVAFSPDSRLVATGSADRIVYIWDAATGAQKHKLVGHEDWITTVVFSPDGSLVASSSGDKTVRIWDTVLGTQKHELTGHKGWVKTVIFSPDGRFVASGSADRIAYIWDVATGTQQHELTGHEDWVTTVAFSPDSHLVATGSADRTVRIWDTNTGSLKQTADFDGPVTKLSFCKSGLYVHSNRGSIALHAPPDSPVHISTHRKKQVSIESEWISIDGEKVLWIPFEYRSPSDSAIRNGTVALGYPSGKFIVVGISAQE